MGLEHTAALSLAVFEQRYRALFDWMTDGADRAWKTRARLEGLMFDGTVSAIGDMVYFNEDAVAAAHAEALLEIAASDEEARPVLDQVEQSLGYSLQYFLSRGPDLKAVQAKVREELEANGVKLVEDPHVFINPSTHEVEVRVRAFATPTRAIDLMAVIENL